MSGWWTLNQYQLAILGIIPIPSKEQARETADAEALSVIEAALELAENGKRWTMEEAFEFARNRRKAWVKQTDDQTQTSFF